MEDMVKEQWWCVLLVGKSPDSWQRAVATRVCHLWECLQDTHHQPAQAICCKTERRAIGFLRLWLKYPRICRAPISFATKAEVLAKHYGLDIFCDFNVIFQEEGLTFYPKIEGQSHKRRSTTGDSVISKRIATEFPSSESVIMHLAHHMLPPLPYYVLKCGERTAPITSPVLLESR